jgi:hypothetical protein
MINAAGESKSVEELGSTETTASIIAKLGGADGKIGAEVLPPPLELTASAITEALQGAAGDPERIGTEYFPDIVEVDGVTLSNSSAVELPAGTLGLNAQGALVVHDGQTTGGRDVAGMRMQGILNHIVSDSIAADQILEIASVVIPVGTFNSTARPLGIVGSVFVRSSLSGYEPAGNPSLIFYLADAAGARNPLAEPDDGLRVPLSIAATPAQLTIMEMCEVLIVNNPSNLLNINLTNIVGAIRRRTLAAGVATVTETNLSTHGLLSERNIPYGGAGQFAFLKIGLFLPADAATANASGSIIATCDLRIII